MSGNDARTRKSSLYALVAEAPNVSRPRVSREREPAEEEATDPNAELEGRVRVALSTGARSLAEVTDRVNAEVEPEARFVTAGRIANASAALARAAAERERPWVRVEGAMEIEDWRLRSRDESGEE